MAGSPLTPRTSSSGNLFGSILPNSLANPLGTIPVLPILNAPTGQASAGQTLTPQLAGGSSQPLGTSTVTTPATAATQQNAANGEIMETVLARAIANNSLNNFYQPAYHFRLFTMRDSDLLVMAGNPTRVSDLYLQIDTNLAVVVIAETGVTTYNIRDVQMDAVVGPNGETKNTNATRFTITVTEPMGVGFLEAMKVACTSLQISNFIKAAYFLELTFLGYDSNGQPQSGMLSDMHLDNGGRWLWALQVTNIDTHLDSSGGTYTIAAIGWNEAAYDADISTMPETATVSGATVKDLFSDYQNKLNASYKDRYNGTLITYEIAVHPFAGPNGATVDPNTFKLLPTQPDLSSTRAVSLSSTNGTSTAIIQHGTTASDFIEYVLAATEEGQNLGLDRDNNTTQTSASASQANSKKFRETTVLRVEPDVEITGFDLVSNTYIRKVTLHVHGHYTQAVVTDDVQRQNSLDPQVQADMLNALIKRKALSKRYDYLYTGLNTEVIDFEIHFNLAWNAVVSRLAGTRAQYENNTANARLGPQNTNPEGNSPESKTAVLEQKKAAVQAMIASADQTRDQLAGSQKTSADLQQQKANSPDQTVVQNQIDAQTRLQADLTNVIKNQVAAISTARDEVNALGAAQKTQVQLPAGGVYAEEIVAKQSASGSNGDDTSRLHNVPVSLIQQYKTAENTVGTGVTGPFHRDRSVFGAVLAQLYDQEFNQLMSISLTVRGDPFWLGQGNMERAIVMRQSSGASPVPVTGLPDYWSGDATLLLNFRYPIRVGDDLAPVFKADDVITSLYRVTTVENRFADGVFKQTLKAFRLPLTQIAQALKTAASSQMSSSSSSSATSTPLASGPPQSATATGPVATSASSATKTAFINSMAGYAQAQSAKTGVAPEIILAQAALETGYGSHAPNNNYFGIKGPGGTFTTNEADASGNLVPTTASFAGYQSPQASFNAYGNLIANSSYYSNLRAVAASGGSLSQQATALGASGYATDKNYASKVLSIAQGIQLPASTTSSNN